jgi:hypothetical protein
MVAVAFAEARERCHSPSETESKSTERSGR